MEEKELLSIKKLTIKYFTDTGVVHAVTDVSLSIGKGKTLGLVGETGAGKTTTSLGVLRLIPDPPGEIVSGSITFDGQSLLDLSEAEMRNIRGKRISMIFQDPMTSLNPVMTVGDQIREVILLHESMSPAEGIEKAKEILEMVGIQGSRYPDYPHQFSGGMKQRIVIAMAIACQPELILADEPTTALDVTIQAQVLDLIQDLKSKLSTSMLLITHDLGIVAEICDEVAIMYAGEIIENGTVEQIFTNPTHPYTKGLFNSIPKIDSESTRLEPIKGLMPDPMNLPEGCSFHPRCPDCTEACMKQSPVLEDLGMGHLVACHVVQGKGVPS